MFSSPFTTRTFLLFLVASTPVYSALAPPLDAATLLSNGQEAQRLNAFFQTINPSDCCTDGDKVCIGGAIALCQNGLWDTTGGRCPTSQNCFALPDFRIAGTVLSCTSEKSAVSAIQATGATGGISGDTKTTSPSTASSTFTPDNTSAASLTATQPVTVTVTLTAQVTTLLPETRTLSPQEAYSVLASLMADGGAIINSSSSATSVNPVVTSTLGSQSAEATSSRATPLTDLTAEPARLDSPTMATPPAPSPDGCY